MNLSNLSNKAKKLRIDTFDAFIKKGEAHLGGSFPIIEILLSIYEIFLKKNDKFILSKSHSSFPLCILLKQKGIHYLVNITFNVIDNNRSRKTLDK